jgi:hypothetical protein
MPRLNKTIYVLQIYDDYESVMTFMSSFVLGVLG